MESCGLHRSLAFRGRDLGGKPGWGWDRRVRKLGRAKARRVEHLPHCFPAVWGSGDRGARGMVAERVAAGASWGPASRRGCQSATCVGRRCSAVRAIPHRPCDQTPALRAAGPDLFSSAQASLARHGSGRAAGSSSPWGCHPPVCWGAGLGVPVSGCECDILVVSRCGAMGGLLGSALL